MHEDARSYVVLKTAMVGNKEGSLVISTNSDALNEVQEVRMMKMHAEDKESDFDSWFDNEFDFDEKVKSGERAKEVGAAVECWMLQSTALEGIIGYKRSAGDDHTDERLVVAFDTQAGPSVVDTGVDLSDCEVTKQDNMQILGAGGKLTSAGVERKVDMVLHGLQQ